MGRHSRADGQTETVSRPIAPRDSLTPNLRRALGVTCAVGGFSIIALFAAASAHAATQPDAPSVPTAALGCLADADAAGTTCAPSTAPVASTSFAVDRPAEGAVVTAPDPAAPTESSTPIADEAAQAVDTPSAIEVAAAEAAEAATAPPVAPGETTTAPTSADPTPQTSVPSTADDTDDSSSGDTTAPGAVAADPTGGSNTTPLDVTVDPGTTPVDPGTTPVDPGTTPVDPGTSGGSNTTPPDVTVDPGTTPTDPGTTPTNPGTTPTNPATTPADPGTTPGDPGPTTEPGGGTTTTPPEKPVEQTNPSVPTAVTHPVHLPNTVEAVQVSSGAVLLPAAGPVASVPPDAVTGIGDAVLGPAPDGSSSPMVLELDEAGNPRAVVLDNSPDASRSMDRERAPTPLPPPFQPLLPGPMNGPSSSSSTGGNGTTSNGHSTIVGVAYLPDGVSIYGPRAAIHEDRIHVPSGRATGVDTRPG